MAEVRRCQICHVRVDRKQPDIIEEAAADEASLFLAVFTCLVILMSGILVVYYLRSRGMSWFPEAWVFLVLGVAVALIVNIGFSTLESVIEKLNESFDRIFFVLLLPPIIFESGYSMEKVSAAV